MSLDFVPLPTDVKAKQKETSLESMIETEVRKLWGDLNQQKQSLVFLEWLSIAVVSLIPKKTVIDQKALIVKIATKLFGLNGQETQRVFNDVEFLFAKGLVKPKGLIEKLIAWIVRFLGARQ
jgi:hypothetical protein